jgi:hypothetical protein
VLVTKHHGRLCASMLQNEVAGLRTPRRGRVQLSSWVVISQAHAGTKPQQQQ